MVRGALDRGAVAFFLSTPERELTNEGPHLGPPPNPAHVREWTLGELEQFLGAEGLHGYFGLTRSNDVMPYMRTSIAAIPGDTAASKDVVRDWFDERRRWQVLAQEQDTLIAELQGWTRSTRGSEGVCGGAAGLLARARRGCRGAARREPDRTPTRSRLKAPSSASRGGFATWR